MRKSILNLVLFVAILGSSFTGYIVGQECEQNCKTDRCSSDGVCICDVPSADTILMGERNFLGGVFCDTPAVMCDGTNSFWCENGGVCDEVVQGENYTCQCPPGFAGLQCNLTGKLCGSMYCYNDGACHDEVPGNETCGCPEDFSGSEDCSIATAAEPDAASPETSTASKKSNGIKWFVPVAAILGALVALCCLCGLCVTCHRRRQKRLSQSRFQELQQLQMNETRDFYDDAEDETGIRKPANGRS